VIKKLKRAIRAIWQRIKQADFEHFGFHIDNYTKLVSSTFGVIIFGFLAFMEYCYLPVVQVQYAMAVVIPGDVIGALFESWTMISWTTSVIMCGAAAAWSLAEFARSFSFWDSYHRRVIELRARINDIESGVGGGNGKHNEWLTRLKFQDSDEARKVANFVFLGRQLNFKAERIKEIVEAHFKD